MTRPEQDDFTPEQWDALCYARRCRLKGSNNTMWYRVLRDLCGWTFGRTALRAHMEKIIDTWLQAHPSWCGAEMAPEDVLRVLRGEEG